MSSIAEKLQRKSQKSVGTKQVRLRLVYIDLWSAVKLSFLIAPRDVTGDETFSIMGSFSLIQIVGFSVGVALLNTIVGTALGAIWALIYNFTVRITGGLLVGFTNN